MSSNRVRRAYSKKQDIECWLKEHFVENYIFSQNADGKYLVNVDGNVDLKNKNLDFILVDFNFVRGTFYVSHNTTIQSLQGSPVEVGMDFICSNSGLNSLVGGPEKVLGSYNCSHNKLTTLIGAPKTKVLRLSVNNNLLTSLEHCPQIVKSLAIAYNDVQNLAFFPKEVANFSCIGNLKLGPYQNMADVYEAHKRDKKILEINTAKMLLEEEVEKPGLDLKSKEMFKL